MNHSRLIALPCKISQGVVSDERAFEVVLSDGRPHLSVAPTYYFWNERKQRLTFDEPKGDQEVAGWVAARLLGRRNGTALVSIPDGSVAEVASASVGPRPSEVVIDVPVRP